MSTFKIFIACHLNVGWRIVSEANVEFFDATEGIVKTMDGHLQSQIVALKPEIAEYDVEDYEEAFLLIRSEYKQHNGLNLCLELMDENFSLEYKKEIALMLEKSLKEKELNSQFLLNRLVCNVIPTSFSFPNIDPKLENLDNLFSDIVLYNSLFPTFITLFTHHFNMTDEEWRKVNIELTDTGIFIRILQAIYDGSEKNYDSASKDAVKRIRKLGIGIPIELFERVKLDLQSTYGYKLKHEDNFLINPMYKHAGSIQQYNNCRVLLRHSNDVLASELLDLLSRQSNIDTIINCSNSSDGLNVCKTISKMGRIHPRLPFDHSWITGTGNYNNNLDPYNNNLDPEDIVDVIICFETPGEIGIDHVLRAWAVTQKRLSVFLNVIPGNFQFGRYTHPGIEIYDEINQINKGLLYRKYSQHGTRNYQIGRGLPTQKLAQQILSIIGYGDVNSPSLNSNLISNSHGLVSPTYASLNSSAIFSRYSNPVSFTGLRVNVALNNKSNSIDYIKKQK